ncbi:sigma-54-dependent Fis family transcriptional regulator [Candidatus Poribacteria bacterium]|nr:sigma-54-dependent Fis family transcriptional regulator [Candidatus Poribacteria bacterium]MYG06689.1 sigma-54-dependent Fis family transcriptional regulator [Candidatus Poribacteria bacterium]MYK22138.1 sigma-54-dependent Fis family transcriptional regulator [Candidatus Poribacteria bacterium]
MGMRDTQNEVRPIELPSAAMQEVHKKVEQFAGIDVPILITGETGVGKEIVAREIHRTSGRNGNPFKAINCSTLQTNGLFESEIFGHERGAFTGATHRRTGAFEEVDTGTLFLDEIGDMPIEVQPKFLRVLESQEFTRLGGNKVIRTDVRVIAATNKDIKAEIESKTFREDLYYRLGIFEIHIPPLRERREDILPLADAFRSEYSREHRKNVVRISDEACDFLERAVWRGNIRELRSEIQKAVVSAETDEITVSNLPCDIVITPKIAAFERGQDSGTVSAIPGEVRQILAMLSVEEFVLLFGGVPKSVWRVLPEKVKWRVIGDASAYLSELLGGQEEVVRIRGLDMKQIQRRVAQQRLEEFGTMSAAADSLGVDPRTLNSYRKRDDVGQ